MLLPLEPVTATIWGEKIVLRILDSSGAFLGPEKLGFEEEQGQIRQLLAKLGQARGLVAGIRDGDSYALSGQEAGAGQPGLPEPHHQGPAVERRFLRQCRRHGAHVR